MLSRHVTHFIVHSPGRTGSILLTRNLCRGISSVTNPIPNRHIVDPSEYEQIVNVQLPRDVIHTHAIIDNPSSKYTQVFNVRLDIAENIMSFLCAEHYKTFHKKPTTLTPFTYTNIPKVYDLCQYITRWYNAYATQLTENNFVVTYEQMMTNLSNDYNGRVFENKQDLILNFDEINQIIKSQESAMLNSLQPFVEHQNPWNIYKYVNYSIRF